MEIEENIKNKEFQHETPFIKYEYLLQSFHEKHLKNVIFVNHA